MYGFLRQRRWIGFALLAIFFMLLFIRLGIWQLARLTERRASNATITANMAATPAPLVDLVESAPHPGDSLEWRTVAVTGRWDVAHQVYWRNRTFDGANGYEVVTPLLPASGPALLVDRGWVPAGAAASAPDNVPLPQEGLVSVVGWLRMTQPERPSGGLAANQVLAINAGSIARGLPYPVYDAYAILSKESPTPASAPTLLPGPDLTEGPHLLYAIQWYLFAGIAVAGWFVYVRREAQDRVAAAAAADTRDEQISAPGPADPPPATAQASTH